MKIIEIFVCRTPKFYISALKSIVNHHMKDKHCTKAHLLSNHLKVKEFKETIERWFHYKVKEHLLMQWRKNDRRSNEMNDFPFPVKVWTRLLIRHLVRFAGERIYATIMWILVSSRHYSACDADAWEAFIKGWKGTAEMYSQPLLQTLTPTRPAAVSRS